MNTTFASWPMEEIHNLDWKLVARVELGKQNRGGLRDILVEGQKLTTGGGLYIIASCTGLDDHVTNLISLSGSGKLEVSDPRAGRSRCGNPRYDVQIEGKNPFTVTYRISGFSQTMGIVNFTLDLEKALTPSFAFSQHSSVIEEGCGNDWQPMDLRKRIVADIRSPCLIPHGVGAVGVARMRPPLVTPLEAVLWGEKLRIEARIDEVTVLDHEGRQIDPSAGHFVSDFGIYNHPGTHAFGSAFYGVPQGYSITLKQVFKVFARSSLRDPSS